MFHLILPHFLRSPEETLPNCYTPALNQLLRFGQFTPHTTTTSQLYAHTFPLSKLPENSALAVPIWQKMGMNTTQLLDARILAISQTEAEQWINELNHFYADDAKFHLLHPTIWQITLPEMQAWSIPSVLDIGGQTDGILRSEHNAHPQWLQLNTELQMWLHSHTLNQKRQTRGEVPINGLWLWQPESHTHHFQAALIGSNSAYQHLSTQITTDAPHDFAAWQRTCDDTQTPLSNSSIFSEDFAQSALTEDVYAYQQQLHSWEQRFFAPLWTAIQQGKLSELTLICEQGHLHISAKRRWQFWRKAPQFDGKHLG